MKDLELVYLEKEHDNLLSNSTETARAELIQIMKGYTRFRTKRKPEKRVSSKKSVAYMIYDASGMPCLETLSEYKREATNKAYLKAVDLGHTWPQLQRCGWAIKRVEIKSLDT